MAKRTRWKIAGAVLAIVIAGIVYCSFFSEDKDGTVKYHIGENPDEADTVVSVNGNGSDNAQADTDIVQSTAVSGKDESGTSASGQEAGADNAGQKMIYVHVCGAVKNPAVYALPDGSRVCDAVTMAGGMTGEAADDYVNQARCLYDGERVYIPEKDELSSLSATQYAAGQPTEASGKDVQAESQVVFPVNINTAGVNELTMLPGIGESRAESIIAYREQHGSFSKKEDIMKISGIKAAAFEKIKDKICTGNE